MIEEVVKNIYRISVPLPQNPLKELNSYFIKGDDSDLLIDTGFRRPECAEALEQGLKELGSDPARRDILVTHLHSDHSGMADMFVGPGRKIYMSEIDLEYKRRILFCGLNEQKRERLRSEGFPEDALEIVYNTNPADKMALPALTDAFHGFKDGDTFTVGEYTLKAIFTPGHTPGNSMFWIEKQGIMFSGDHILFDITPNITQWSEVEDSLGDYLESLKAVKDLPVKLTLPGHRKTGDYKARIEELFVHHDARINEAFEIVKKYPGMNTHDIAGKMTWKIRADSWDTFPVIQKWFAVGECLSHLDYLRLRGKVRKEQQNGIWVYYAL